MSFKQAAKDALGYNPKHTATLIRRDCKDIKTKAMAKVKSMFRRKTVRTSKSAERQASEEGNTLQNDSMETSIVRPEVVERVSEPLQKTIMKPVTDTSANPVAEDKAVIETIYGTMRDNLQVLKGSRDKQAPNEKRWHFLGCWLLLHMAVEYFPSNPLYEALGCGKTADADAAVRAKIIQHTTAATFHASQRCDEVLDTVTFSAEHWWKAIWEATTSHNQAEVVAEALVRHVWPENDAAKVLQLIGSPYEKFFEFDAAELRRRLQVLLLPGLDVALRIQH
ncbi:hypothetical protein J1614_009708 [Plenodomus biglobosus]|nr:hypothetical protein J1614_009708 [Plenodomus biglobosus]